VEDALGLAGRDGVLDRRRVAGRNSDRRTDPARSLDRSADFGDFPAGPPSTVAHANEPETIVADAPAPMELRIALARRAGNELAWAQSDLSTSRGRPTAAGAPAAGSFAPLTYGAALGRLSAEEKDL